MACRRVGASFDVIHESLGSGDSIAGLEAVEAVLKECSGCLHALADKVRLLMARDKYDEAEEVLDAVDAAGEPKAEFIYLRGHVVVGLKSAEAALPWFKRAAAMDPEDHTYSCDLATALISIRKVEEALHYAEVAWLSDMAEDQANMNLLYCVREVGGDTRRLEEVARRAADLDSKSPSVWNQIARCYQVLGRPGLALRSCRKALAIDESYVPGWCLGAELQMDLGYSNQAIRSLMRLGDLDPKQHGKRSLLNLVYVYGDLKGDWPAALEHAVQARGRFPDDEDANAAYHKVVLGISGSQDATRALVGRYEALHHERDELRTAFEGFQPAEKGVPLGVALQRLEGQEIEFIERFPDRAVDLGKEIAAFGTSNNGTIFLGVTDDGAVVGLDNVETNQQKDKMQDRIAGITRGTVDPPISVDVYFLQRAAATLVKVFVPKGPAPVYFAGSTPYVRHLDQSRPATAAEVARLHQATTNGQEAGTAPS